MKRALTLILVVTAAISREGRSRPPEPIAPSPQAMCNSLMMIIGWNDLTESANATNADRVRASGLVRLLGAKLATSRDVDDPAYQLFFPPRPGEPHDVPQPAAPRNVALASTLLPENTAAPKPTVDRLAGLLWDGRNRWQTTRYFFTPFDPLQVTELASMWQRHARNAKTLQERGQAVFGGDEVLTQVQDAVERGLHGNRPFWAHIGFQATVEGIGDADGSLVFPNPGPGYATRYARGTPVQVDYILMYDPTDPSRPSGMTVVLRFPDPVAAR